MGETINRIGVFGPGGIKCGCCAPGTRLARNKWVRPARRRANRFAIAEGVQELREAEAEEAAKK